jgi:hypothetical protein
VKRHVQLGFAILAVLPACGSADRPTEPASTATPNTATVSAADTVGAASSCALSAPTSKIHHIIYVQFDNVHFTRDNPNVPSDLEQMPNLLGFITTSGSLLDNHHTPLISHTADDIVTSLTGVYGDKHGQPVSNAFGYFPLPGTSTSFDKFASSFQYWTDVVSTSTPPADPNFFMLTPTRQNAPAPWVPFTRAGCNVGAASIANIELENVFGDITTVFGAGSPQALEAAANRAQATADFVGIAVHCAFGDGVCSSANGGRPDLLSQEPGGYSGYNALFGHKYVAPVINPGGPLKDLDGNVIQDNAGHVGFPGFGGISAAQSLAYVAAMQEHGVPVTFAYISDAHGNHTGSETAFGPGEAGYVAQLAAYDRAFGEFFRRLASDGITQDNTLFVFTADEGDHFAGGPPSPAGCDGVHVPCTYAKIGEIDANLTALLNGVNPSLASTPFDIHFDMAPTFYVSGNPTPGAAIARAYERAAAQLTAVSPITGNTDTLMQELADPVEMKLLHMVTGDPQRTPTFVMFGDPDYFFLTSGPLVQEDPTFAWNHGGTNREIVTTWLGMVGPGVRRGGIEDDVWSDHTDIRPTMLLLAGLTDDYAHDGRALVEALEQDSLPQSLAESEFLFRVLANAYKQINAPVGGLGKKTLALSTKALSGDDAKYAALEAQLGAITVTRDAIAAQMIQGLEAAEFRGTPLGFAATLNLLKQASALLFQVELLAASQ